jgi:hypothetical protein
MKKSATKSTRTPLSKYTRSLGASASARRIGPLQKELVEKS